MKKYLLLLLMVTFTFVGCDYDDDFTPPNYVTFDSDEKELSVLDTGSETLEVTVFTANTTGSDRTFAINVDEESTLDPSTYTLPATVTIPANSNEVTFSIEVTGAGIDDYGDELVLELPEEGDLSAGSTLSINVIKVCPFDINAFVGTYDASEVFTGGSNEGYSFGEGNGLTLQVELAVNANDASGNSLVLTNSAGHYEFIPNGTVVTFDPETGAPSLPSDVTVFGYPFSVKSKKYNTCAQVMSFTGNLANFGEYTVTFEKQ